MVYYNLFNCEEAKKKIDKRVQNLLMKVFKRLQIDWLKILKKEKNDKKNKMKEMIKIWERDEIKVDFNH